MSSSRKTHGVSVLLFVRGAFGLCMIRYRSIIVSALTIALLIATIVTFVDSRIQRIEDGLTSAVGMTSEEFSSRLEQELVFDEEAHAEAFFVRLSSLGFPYHGTVTADSIIPVFILRIAPYALFLALAEVFILSLAFTYFLLFFLSPSASEMDALKKLPASYCRLFGLTLWMFIRSMVWIPFIGPVIAIYLCPRFILAPVLVLSGRAKVFVSVTESIHSTYGGWLRMCIAIFLWLTLCILAFWFMAIFVSIPTVFFPKIGYLLFLIGLQLIIAYSSAYVLVLSELSA